MSNLMPPNATPLERHAATATASATELPVILRDLWNPEACPAELLPWLAWAWSVDSWNDSWSERQQRNTIAEALEVQQIKGTIGAVRTALGAIGFDARVQEWHRQSPAGDPYTFRIYLDVEQEPMDQRGIERALQIVESTKSLRSHLETVVQRITTRTTVNVAAVANTGSESEIAYSATAYSDGAIAWDLMLDAAYHGEDSTVGGIDALHTLVQTTMTPTYW